MAWAASTDRFDVAIAGAGPAGCAAALSLIRAGWSVLLTDAGRRPRREVGETLPAATRLVLERLGVASAFDAQGFPPCHLRTSAWGVDEPTERSSLQDAYGPSFFIERGRFDAMLRAEASARGAQLRTEAALRTSRAAEDGSGFELVLEHEGARIPIEASYLIDATGRSAALARDLGTTWVHADDLRCVVARLEPWSADRARATHVETARHGWWYRGLSSDETTTVLLFTDTELVRSLELTKPAGWAALFRESSLTGGASHDWAARLQGPLESRSARCRRLAPVAAHRWAAVGDAAVTFDPLSSRGLTAALMSGMHAATALVAHRRGDPRAIDRYGHVMEQVFAEHLDQRRAYYAMEQRWRDSPFWSSRLDSPPAE